MLDLQSLDWNCPCISSGLYCEQNELLMNKFSLCWGYIYWEHPRNVKRYSNEQFQYSLLIAGDRNLWGGICLEMVFFGFQSLCHEYVASVVVQCSALILFLVLTDANDFAFFLLLKSGKWWNNILKSKPGRLCLRYAMNLLTSVILEFIDENIFLFRLKLAIKGNNHQSGVILIL